MSFNNLIKTYSYFQPHYISTLHNAMQYKLVNKNLEHEKEKEHEI